MDDIGKALYFVQILRNQQNRRTRIARRDQARLDIGNRPHVQTPDWLIGKDDLWARLKHPAKDQLLHIAARQKPDALQHPLTAHVVFGDDILGKALRRRPVHPAIPAEGGAGIGF